MYFYKTSSSLVSIASTNCMLMHVTDRRALLKTQYKVSAFLKLPVSLLEPLLRLHHLPNWLNIHSAINPYIVLRYNAKQGRTGNKLKEILC